MQNIYKFIDKNELTDVLLYYAEIVCEMYQDSKFDLSDSDKQYYRDFSDRLVKTIQMLDAE